MVAVVVVPLADVVAARRAERRIAQCAERLPACDLHDVDRRGVALMRQAQHGLVQFAPTVVNDDQLAVTYGLAAEVRDARRSSASRPSWVTVKQLIIRARYARRSAISSRIANRAAPIGARICWRCCAGSGNGRKSNVVVVEQDAVPRLDAPLECGGGVARFAYNPGPFNKAWGLNLAVALRALAAAGHRRRRRDRAAYAGRGGGALPTASRR